MLTSIKTPQKLQVKTVSGSASGAFGPKMMLTKWIELQVPPPDLLHGGHVEDVVVGCLYGDDGCPAKDVLAAHRSSHPTSLTLYKAQIRWVCQDRMPRRHVCSCRKAEVGTSETWRASADLMLTAHSLRA